MPFTVGGGNTFCYVYFSGTSVKVQSITEVFPEKQSKLGSAILGDF
jgi:hypothetical protein